MNLYKVTQNLISNAIKDIPSEVRNQLDSLEIAVPQGEVAITAGSRGIANNGAIIKTIGDWLRAKGAAPFIVPCMGSHGGATAEGQLQMLQNLGITKEAAGMEIRSSMEVKKIGTGSYGDIYMDKNCFQAAGVLVVNRIKQHTSFTGQMQSGLVKMMVVGMGKRENAECFHKASPDEMSNMLHKLGTVIIYSGKILAGLAVIEDGYDQTAEIHALSPAEILAKEPELLHKQQTYAPRLPLDDINVLVIQEMGKNISGTGIDTTVIGYRGMRGGEDLTTPNVNVLAVLSLSKASGGNALGVGLADFITRRLRDAIDEEKTFINTLTTGNMIRNKIPSTLKDDEELVKVIEKRFGEKRWVFIPNTLHLETFYVSADLVVEIKANAICTVDKESYEIKFKDGVCRLFG